ncbi:isochorismatase family protein [Serratia ficaria]|uniref:Peroxyureidoacrylate/ureidoacrylate amidohydrolase RutB n=1 Tax=Serratia ficaria TaxID=61651 RepID=A0A240BY23_SERFI|nr:isochorismatase family cysteine hydrolase [Serratia ficaria]REF45196.1 nicotinamidase-related amidase [Serratia ficaria]CAI0714589.1 Peroxyureidoacrylate/ureidoacrylate amidohydrolase RutB [Serratia ficaria]CAI0826451.1 Peroxyureidoacrylate/ureidoacrylate amidohydrolase RutB [Serratia ficaria]CAI0868730.1 Peroxyureidoacrylate/ureidoacrylate amidohydrolase RutB [Serratia ficaria]CAI0912041.1 Peroxyureidoacrylate/ureidoacrylate amidohydrolase RutB [Serratia ficaria]
MQRQTQGCGHRAAILVIDMQHDFLDADAPIPCSGGLDIVESLHMLLDFARGEGISVIYTQEAHRTSRVDFGRELDYGETLHCLEGTQGVDIIPQLCPQNGDLVLIKRRYSAFFATDLDLLLRGLGVDTLVLTGVATDVCVRATAQDAMQLDYHVVVPRECVAGTNLERHDAALENINYVFGKVQDLVEVIDVLRMREAVE